MEHFFAEVKWTPTLRCTPESNHWEGCRCRPYSNYWGIQSNCWGRYIPPSPPGFGTPDCMNSSKHARQLFHDVIVHAQKHYWCFAWTRIRIFCLKKLPAFSVTFALFMAFDTIQAKSIASCAEGARRFIKLFADFAKHNAAFYIVLQPISSYFPRILESSFTF